MSAFALKLIRRPKASNSMRKAIQTEVRKTLTDLSGKIKTRMEQDVNDWDEQPKLSVDIAVDNQKWQIVGKVDKRSKIGKIYGWVDHGTASRGDQKGDPYVIRPRSRNGVLRFEMPHSPKSLPNPAIPGFPSKEPVHGVITQEVIHPGIYPRNFTKVIVEEYLGRKPGSFKAVIDAAVKRAVRANK